MGKHGLSLAQLRAEKQRSFFEKLNRQADNLTLDERRSYYHCVLVFASEYISLIEQDEVVDKAQKLFDDLKQRWR